MKRRNFLGLLALGVAAGNAVAQEVARRIEDQTLNPALKFINKKAGTHPFRVRRLGWRPHIFLITLDMVSPDHYHSSRPLHNQINLPTIRSLFNEGVVFENAFCSSP